MCGKVAEHGGVHALQKAASAPLRAQIPIEKLPENISLSKKKSFQINLNHKNFHDVSKIYTLGYRE
jgi:hypothetical protein